MVATTSQTPVAADVAASPFGPEWSPAEVRHCAPGEQLFAEGEAAAGLWFVTAGRVRLSRRDTRGREIVTAFQGPGAALDLAAALDGHAHSATAVATDATELLFVSRAQLVTMLDDPALRARLYGLIGREMRQRDVLMRVLYTKKAQARVYCSLLHLAQCFGIGEGGAAAISGALRRQDIADLTGIRIETAIRIMSDLEKRDIIHTANQEIRLLDREQLMVLNGCLTCRCDCSVFDPPPSEN